MASGAGKVLSDMAAQMGMSPAQQDILRRLDADLGRYDKVFSIMSAWGLSIKPNFPRGITGAGTIPVGTIAIFDTSCPSGWTRVSAFDGKALRGASTYGGTGGTATPTMPSHDHSFSDSGSTNSTGAHTHSYALTGTSGGNFLATGSNWGNDGAGTGSEGSHSHTFSVGGTTGSASSGSTNWPPYIDVVFCKYNG